MSQQLTTTEECGEDDKSFSNKPTLKEFLCRELGAESDVIHTELTSKIGITDIDALIFCDERDLIELCQALKLTFGNKMKFKAGVRKLKHEFQPKQTQIVTVSATEQSMINKINTAIKQSNDIQQMFEQHFNTIHDDVAILKIKIDDNIDNLIKSLQNKKKGLNQSLEQWKLDKMTAINEETAYITQYRNALQTAKDTINTLFKTNALRNRDTKIKAILDQIFKDNEYNKYQNISSLRECIMNNMKTIDIIFEHNINIKLNTDIHNAMFNIPSIELDEIKKTREDGNGYEVELNWLYSSNEEEKTPDFILNYAENDEEMKQEMNWITLNDCDIQRENGNRFSVHITKYFKFYKIYSFMVQNVIQKPLNLRIDSNIRDIRIEGMLDKAKEEQIPLKIHSHKAHYASYVPQRMLQHNTKENNYYLSPYGQCKDDWIIFNINDEHMFYPTKMQLVVCGGYLDCAPKRFWVKIGNPNTNQWINCHKNAFNGNKTHSQTFELDIDHEKYRNIKNNGFKQFKLEILNNHDPNKYILISELKLFGVRM